MRSSFGGLSIGVSGLWAQQKALDVTGHNISNVNTPGYSRQSVMHESSRPVNISRSGNGNLLNVGTGVDVQEIRRFRDYFLDSKLRRENQSLGYWEARRSSIQELETIFNDNTEEGLQKVMDNFWNSWSQLSKPSGGLAARALVKENAIAFIETVKKMDTMLTNFRNHRNDEIKENVDKVNAMLRNIADINYNIIKIEGSGAVANDLRDQREKLVMDLSRLANIQVVEGTKFSINLEGRSLVFGNEYTPLTVVPEKELDGYYSIRWSATMEKIDINGGSIKSLLDTRDELVYNFRNKLNEFVKGVADEINKLHHAGYGNVDDVNRYMFINGNTNTHLDIDIQNITYNPELLEVNNIAAAKLKPPGNYEDNQNALEISGWRHKEVFLDNTYSPVNGKFNFDEFYRSIITEIGLEGSKAINAADSQALLVNQLENKKLSLTAVSLDEEMSNLIRFEHSYNAAARIVNAVDEMIEIIVNKVGLVGR